MKAGPHLNLMRHREDRGFTVEPPDERNAALSSLGGQPERHEHLRMPGQIRRVEGVPATLIGDDEVELS